MALTSDQLQATVDALESALGRGVLKIEVDGESITYNSTNDMMTALRYFQGRLVEAAGGTAPRQSLLSYASE